MKIKPLAVVITDTHMNDKNITLVKDIFKQTFEYCKTNGIKLIFHAGDWFTSRTGQSIACLMATKDILEQMHREYGLEMWAIAGNHDKANQNIPESFLSIFEDRPGFRLVRNFEGFPLIKNKISVNFLPFFSKEVYEENLSLLNSFIFEDPEGYDPKCKQILITHSAINGVKNNDGSTVTEGSTPNMFKNYHSVFVGHYHNKSKVGKNVYYIGSGYQANFGEDDQKGLTVLYEDCSHEQVVLNFPKFVKFKIEASDLDAATIMDLKAIKEESPQNNYRIVLSGTEQEVNSFNKSILESVGISVDKKPNDVELLEPDEEIEVVTYNSENIVEAFQQFCETKNINPDYGLEIIKRIQ